MANRRVSCICPTYNRPPHFQHLLEEAIESFLRQDYDDKELIILNDCEQQTLSVWGPGFRNYSPMIRVINWRSRFATLGEKYNAAIGMATGEYICPWEDDDISLPWRLSTSIRYLSEYDYWNPKAYWYWPANGELTADHGIGVAHNASIFRRDAWKTAGGYPAESGAQDRSFDQLLRQRCNVRPWRCGDLRVVDWSYIYRWGVSDVHLSGKKPHQQFYDEVGQRKVEANEWGLSHKWHHDYDILCRNHPAAVIPK